MNLLKGRGRITVNDYHASRKRIREGTASNRDEELFEMCTGKSASSVKKECLDQRAVRLEKARVANTNRLKNESNKERCRRKEADKIRHQLRRSCYYPRNQTFSAHERKAYRHCQNIKTQTFQPTLPDAIHVTNRQANGSRLVVYVQVLIPPLIIHFKIGRFNN